MQRKMAEQENEEDHFNMGGARCSEDEEREPRKHDEKHYEYKEVSQVTLPTDRIPSDILARANKIFSKHQAKDVREWSRLLMKNYQLLHAVEKPMNLDYVKPFANTSNF
jgi:hypothetical protein